MPRFFRRIAEGVFDMEDLQFRTYELADFIQDASKVYGFDLQHLVGIGYSNGANIAASCCYFGQSILSNAILFRPMVPLVPEVLPNLSSKRIFISSGLHDPIVQSEERKSFEFTKKSGCRCINKLAKQWP